MEKILNIAIVVIREKPVAIHILIRGEEKLKYKQLKPHPMELEKGGKWTQSEQKEGHSE